MLVADGDRSVVWFCQTLKLSNNNNNIKFGEILQLFNHQRGKCIRKQLEYIHIILCIKIHLRKEANMLKVLKGVIHLLPCVSACFAL